MKKFSEYIREDHKQQLKDEIEEEIKNCNEPTELQALQKKLMNLTKNENK